MQLIKYRTSQLRQQLATAERKGDKLELFVLGNVRDELDSLYADNMKLALDTAAELKLDYVYFGKSELAGCAKHRTKAPNGFTTGNSSIWVLAERLGIRGGCGNGDQYQINGWHKEGDQKSFMADGTDFFGPQNIGAWDIAARRKLTPGEEFNKPFFFVVERDDKRKEYENFTPLPRRPAKSW